MWLSLYVYIYIYMRCAYIHMPYIYEIAVNMGYGGC